MASETSRGQVSHLSRGAWIEMDSLPMVDSGHMSHLSRGAWIEIGHMLCGAYRKEVAPLTGAWIEMS